MKFVRDSILTFLTYGATFALGMASSVLITRFLGPEGKGIFSLIAGLFQAGATQALGTSGRYGFQGWQAQTGGSE